MSEESQSESRISAQMRVRREKTLEERRILEVDPSSSYTVKRDVRTIRVAADAREFANAFHETMIDPKRRFGIIRVVRRKARVGKPFEVGEQFQGHCSLKDVIAKEMEDGLRGGARRLLVSIMNAQDIARLLRTFEDQFASDYGIRSSTAR